MKQEKKLLIPEDFCQSMKKISRVCVNHICSNPAFLCGTDECQTCESAHLACRSIRLKQITFQVNDLKAKQQSLWQQMNQMENEFVNNLVHIQFRQNLNLSNQLSILQKHKITIDRVFKHQDWNNVFGREVGELEQFLKMENQKREELVISLTDEYRSQLNSLADRLKKRKQELYKSLSTERCVKQEEQIDHEIEEKLLLEESLFGFRKGHKQFQARSKDSQHLMKHFQSQQMKSLPEEKGSLIDSLMKDELQFLNKLLKNPDNFQLIFRGSQHGFKASAFHRECDDFYDTITLIKTQGNALIGGFTHYPWNSKSNAYFGDKQKKSFIFSVSTKQSYFPNDQYSQIFCYRGYGPTFGLGFDLCIADQCHTNSDSFANFLTTYCLNQNKKKVSKTQKQIERFIGKDNGEHFKVAEYEVFRVVYPQQ